MSKITILDEVLSTFDILGKSDIPMKQIYSQIQKNREKSQSIICKKYSTRRKIQCSITIFENK